VDLGRIGQTLDWQSAATSAIQALWSAVANCRGSTKFLIEWTTVYLDTGSWYARELRYDRAGRVLRDFTADSYFEYTGVEEHHLMTLNARSYRRLVSVTELKELGCPETWRRSRYELPFQSR